MNILHLYMSTAAAAAAKITRQHRAVSQVEMVISSSPAGDWWSCKDPGVSYDYQATVKRHRQVSYPKEKRVHEDNLFTKKKLEMAELPCLCTGCNILFWMASVIYSWFGQLVNGDWHLISKRRLIGFIFHVRESTCLEKRKESYGNEL